MATLTPTNVLSLSATLNIMVEVAEFSGWTEKQYETFFEKQKRNSLLYADVRYVIENDGIGSYEYGDETYFDEGNDSVVIISVIWEREKFDLHVNASIDAYLRENIEIVVNLVKKAVL
jgi:hypothetical protein